jgi:hypothetical protein
MSTLSEFMARGVRRGEERGQSRARSMSHGPVVVLKGWRKGMDKAAVTLLLRNSGVPLADAHAATESILRGEPASVYLPKGVKVTEVRRELGRLGVIL